jgi:hypothetical protein
VALRELPGYFGRGFLENNAAWRLLYSGAAVKNGKPQEE